MIRVDSKIADFLSFSSNFWFVYNFSSHMYVFLLNSDYDIHNEISKIISAACLKIIILSMSDCFGCMTR